MTVFKTRPNQKLVESAKKWMAKHNVAILDGSTSRSCPFLIDGHVYSAAEAIAKYVEDKEASRISMRLLASFDTDATLPDRVAMLSSLTSVQLDALRQLAQPVWDGNLISKVARTELVEKGLVSQWDGLNFATQDGYAVLSTMNMLGDTSRFDGGLPRKVSSSDDDGA